MSGFNVNPARIKDAARCMQGGGSEKASGEKRVGLGFAFMVRITSTQGGRHRLDIGRRELVTRFLALLKFSRDGMTACSRSDDQQAHRWSIASRQPLPAAWAMEGMDGGILSMNDAPLAAYFAPPDMTLVLLYVSCGTVSTSLATCILEVTVVSGAEPCITVLFVALTTGNVYQNETSPLAYDWDKARQLHIP
ncbi:hypothetical protein OG21DRAFT_1527388 [Imleria badia]|nr:hypothetical protein OG21DRAFT_1527388 [Imleria badia]